MARRRQAKDIVLPESHIKEDMEEFDSLTNQIEDMKEEDQQALKKQSADTPPESYYEEPTQKGPSGDQKYQVGETVTFYDRSGEQVVGKIIEVLVEDREAGDPESGEKERIVPQYHYDIEKSETGELFWVWEEDIKGPVAASRRRAMANRRRAGFGSWMDEYTKEELDNMPVQVVFIGADGNMTNREYPSLAEAQADHPDMSMSQAQAMRGALYTDEAGPAGSPCMRFEDAETYRNLSAMKRTALRLEDFQVGDPVTHAKWGDGEVTYVGSGPNGDKVSVDFTNPMQSLMGPAIVNPAQLQKGHSGTDPWGPAADDSAKEAEVNMTGRGIVEHGCPLCGSDLTYTTLYQEWECQGCHQVFQNPPMEMAAMLKTAEFQVGDRVVFHGPEGDVNGVVYHAIEEHDKSVDVLFDETGEWDSCLIDKVEKLAMKKQAHGGVSASEENGHLVITVDPETQQEVKELVESGDTSDQAMWNLFDTPGFMGSGYNPTSPESIGALTSAPIIEHDGQYYWYPQYESRSPLEDLAETGKTVFQGAQVEKSGMKIKASVQPGDRIKIIGDPENRTGDQGKEGVVVRMDEFSPTCPVIILDGGTEEYSWRAEEVQKIGMKKQAELPQTEKIMQINMDIMEEAGNPQSGMFLRQEPWASKFAQRVKSEVGSVGDDVIRELEDENYHSAIYVMVMNGLTTGTYYTKETYAMKRRAAFDVLPTMEDCEFEIVCEPEGMQPEGNASAIDEETDKQVLQEIYDQLESGNQWAWCSVHVICKWTDEDGQEYKGDDYLGGCSYKSEADFKQPGGYYDDMKQVSYDNMVQNMPAPTHPGREARRVRTAMKKTAETDWNELAQYLKERSAEICQLNGCTEDQHNCESYAYIDANGRLLDVCGSDYFQGSGEPYAGISLPFEGTGDELKEEVAEQTFDEFAEEEDQGVATGASRYLKPKRRTAVDDEQKQSQILHFVEECRANGMSLQECMSNASAKYYSSTGDPAISDMVGQVVTQVYKEASCPPGLSKDVKDKVKEEYGPDNPKTYQTLWKIKDEQKEGMLRRIGEDMMSHVQSCEICGKAIMGGSPDDLCPVGQQFWKKEIENAGGEVTDPNFGKVTALKIGEDVFLRDLKIKGHVKMIEGELVTISNNLLGDHFYVVGDDNIVRRRRRYATVQDEVNDLERMKLRIEEQKKDTVDETQMQALEERLKELDREIGNANAKEAMENPHFWDKVGEEIEDGTDKKLRSPSTEEVSEEGHDEQRAHPSKGEPGEGSEYRHEISAESFVPSDHFEVGDTVTNQDGTLPQSKVVEGPFPSDGTFVWVDVPDEGPCQYRPKDLLKVQASEREAEDAVAPTLGGMLENVEQKVDAGEAGPVKFALDKDMFKDDKQKAMEADEDAVVNPGKKKSNPSGGGYQSSAPFVGPSAMPGQNM
jgi:ribosomal protein L37AE/L43A